MYENVSACIEDDELSSYFLPGDTIFCALHAWARAVTNSKHMTGSVVIISLDIFMFKHEYLDKMDATGVMCSPLASTTSYNNNHTYGPETRNAKE